MSSLIVIFSRCILAVALASFNSSVLGEEVYGNLFTPKATRISQYSVDPSYSSILEVLEDERWCYLGSSTSSGTDIYITFPHTEEEHILALGNNNFDYAAFQIVGPCNIRMKNTNTDWVSFLSYKIIKPETSLLSNAVTLSSSGGGWKVQLEQSTDLKNWTPVVPGTFSGDLDLQFFRVNATLIQSP